MQLGLAQKCHYNGKVYLIVGVHSKFDWVLYDPEQPQSNALVVRKDYTQPVATELFQVGDRVRSHCTFRGTVTGFEEHNNRIVCVSDKMGEYVSGDRDRTRFAYKPHELMHIAEETTMYDHRTVAGSF